MKVALVNGSPHKNGCTYTALSEVAKTLNEEDIETEIFWIGTKALSGCIACKSCVKTGKCIFDDVVNEFHELAKECDGFVFGCPVHYGSMSASLSAFMDRLFYSELCGCGNENFYMKPAAAVISARRAGTTATFDQINKYFTIQEMPVVSSRYWNMVHGAAPNEVAEDKEGLYTMRVLGRNMAFIESPTYDGENLSKKGDVVVVSVNHRLNSLGHLDLSDYGDKYKYSANAGITDIIKSLEWIRDNIESFGGDPDNVTVFGESGGGAKVLALMTSPYAKGLFHKGIVESGATENMGAAFMSREASKRVTEITLENLGIKADEIEKMQTVSYADLTAASDKALTQAAEELNIYEEFVNGYSLLWEPVVDGDFLPTSPVTDTGFAEAGKDIPLLIGSNLNEWTVFGNPMGDPDEKLSASELDTRLKEKYGDNADKVKNEFKKAYPNESDTAALYIDTTLIRLPILKLTAHKADQNGAPVYSYMFTWGTSYHTAEIPFVFNNIDKVQPSGDRAEAERLSDIMSSAWINFAKTGNPNGSGVPSWEPYTRDGGATMIFDNKSYLTNNHDKELMSILAPDYKY